jgi:hypothetical protein
MPAAQRLRCRSSLSGYQALDAQHRAVESQRSERRLHRIPVYRTK